MKTFKQFLNEEEGKHFFIKVEFLALTFPINEEDRVGFDVNQHAWNRYLQVGQHQIMSRAYIVAGDKLELKSVDGVPDGWISFVYADEDTSVKYGYVLITEKKTFDAYAVTEKEWNLRFLNSLYIDPDKEE